MDVNPPVTVRTRAASVAPGAHEGLYRPIDIDRTPFMIETRRVYGLLKVHGTLTCVSKQKLLCRKALRRWVFPLPHGRGSGKALGGCDLEGFNVHGSCR
jgi:hypothetical protein